MKKILPLLTIFLLGCARLPLDGENYSPGVDALPRFVQTDFVDLAKIAQISRFRSSAGHDYSDYYESERSMKHYYYPSETYEGTTDQIEIFAPFDGQITMMFDEGNRGYQCRIVPKDYPYITVVIFHIIPDVSLGDWVNSGDILGYADVSTDSVDSPSSDFDIAVWLADGHLVSWFDILSDAVFSSYQSRGVTDREEMLFTQEEADDRPVNFPSGNNGDWVVLL